jgi:hypothetical protein
MIILMKLEWRFGGSGKDSGTRNRGSPATEESTVHSASVPIMGSDKLIFALQLSFAVSSG